MSSQTQGESWLHHETESSLDHNVRIEECRPKLDTNTVNMHSSIEVQEGNSVLPEELSNVDSSSALLWLVGTSSLQYALLQHAVQSCKIEVTHYNPERFVHEIVIHF